MSVYIRDFVEHVGQELLADVFDFFQEAQTLYYVPYVLTSKV